MDGLDYDWIDDYQSHGKNWIPGRGGNPGKSINTRIQHFTLFYNSRNQVGEKVLQENVNQLAFEKSLDQKVQQKINMFQKAVTAR